jgi:anti-anti-sigma regulatory factor
MPVERWSDNVIVVRLAEDPHLGDDLDALDQATVPPATGGAGRINAVVDFTAVKAVNSSNLARLLKVRRQMQANGGGRLILCGLVDQVWGAFLVTNLDKLFDFSTDMSTALTALQLNPTSRPPA